VAGLANTVASEAAPTVRENTLYRENTLVPSGQETGLQKGGAASKSSNTWNDGDFTPGVA